VRYIAEISDTCQHLLHQSDTFRIYHFERRIEKASQHIRFLCAHNCLNFRTCLIHVEACLLVFALIDKNTCRAQAVIEANQGLRSLWITCAASAKAVFAVRDPDAGSNGAIEICLDAGEYLLGRIIHCWISWRLTDGLRGKAAKIGRRDGTVRSSRHDVSDSYVVAFEISLNVRHINRPSAECKARLFVQLRALCLFAEDGLHLFRFVLFIETPLADVVLVHLGALRHISTRMLPQVSHPQPEMLTKVLASPISLPPSQPILIVLYLTDTVERANYPKMI
jgi:hypothetical protein